MADPTERRQPASPDRTPPGWRVEGARKGEGQPPAKGRLPRPNIPFGRRFLIFIVALLALNWFLASLLPNDTPSRMTVPYSTFRAEAVKGNVAHITAKGDTIEGEFRQPVTIGTGKDAATNTRFKTERPSFGDDALLPLLISKGTVVDATPIGSGRSTLATILLGFGPTILLVVLFVWLMRRAAGGAGGAIGSFGRSRAKRYEQTEQRTTFQDVAGIEEAEEELVEIVDFLRNPERYSRLGGAIPKGVLLYGPPGTGKTLLARAVAGEADVPFFSLSASEFVEMIVGVGASRARDLFAQAKAAAPAIIFIDELDAIGRARGGGASIGGHDEREQTLNQILTEMDGFTGSEGVIVLASTNRPEVLDPALLRPGRFDRRVAVNPPDQRGRRAILEVHTRKVPLADDVDLDAIASTTPGMVGADLRNLVNEAALTAARRDHETVSLNDFMDALEKIILGAERRIMLSREEKERTAYHESGHAILGMLQPITDPVRKVSIVPRGRALGVTFTSPDADRYGYSEEFLRGRIVTALGGRAAEEIVYGDVTTGAESDLEHITRIARQMVGRWGMSPRVGNVSVLPGPADEPTLFPGVGGPTSERTREIVDEEVRRIVDESYAAALEQLRANRHRLEALTQGLLEHETLDEADAYRVAGIPRRPPPDEPVVVAAADQALPRSP